ncbi:MAG: Rieske (2Fe-2S) protein [Candidatus Caenarcaniphilales bacterium]|nr:Rieske (2Fe-2S) protein [Candidatus Caenarcaniphilales bacterium]
MKDEQMTKEKNDIDEKGEEFVDSPERRNFMGTVIGAATAAYAAGIGFVIYRYLSTGITDSSQLDAIKKIKVDGAEALANNSFKMFKFGSKPGLLIKDSSGKLSAFNAICSHLGCTVSYQPDNKRIFCACHGGVYNPETGKNISGPPPEPLKVYKVLVEADGIYVEKA